MTAHATTATKASVEPVVRLRGIEKSFLGVRVLKGVDLDLVPGEVHALVGENGAGKSTLMKVLAGIHGPDAGQVEIAGAVRQLSGPREAQQAGIAIIHQELTLLPHRTVAENVFLGREPVRRGAVDGRAMVHRTRELLADLGEEGIPATAAAGSLPVAQQQVVEIVKALAVEARVLAMDEPTAALADTEVAMLYRLVRRLADRGLAILYVSHRMREVFDLSQRVTVLKDGAHVVTAPTASLTSEQVVRHMVGRPLDAMFPDLAKPREIGDVRFSVSGGGNSRLSGIDLELRAGEIVGLAGLQGSGRSAVARAIAGVDPFTVGDVRLDGAPVRLRSPRRGIAAGIAFVTEDRKAEGLALRQSVRDNALLVRRSAGRARRNGPVDVPALLRSVTVTARSPEQEARYLSGGNQQKVVLAKWLAVQPRVLLVDEPTRGIDVGAKAAIYELLRGLAKSGVAVLVISSELPELIGMSDRVLVMHEGRLAGHLAAGPTEEDVMALATGHGAHEGEPR